MQTFAPLTNRIEIAWALDRQRLGKQRVEVYQIARTLLGESQGWRNHPAVRMWRGHEDALIQYGLTMCSAWIARGYKDTLSAKLRVLAREHALVPETAWERNAPDWWGDERFHASHRSALLRKAPEFYERYGWTDSPDAPYFWPV